LAEVNIHEFGFVLSAIGCAPGSKTCPCHNFRISFPEIMNIIMPIRQKKSLSEYRRRLKRRGVVRLEVNVRKEDASLVRSVVTALSDPSRESETRAMLRERFGGSKAANLKALLVSAPLEGIDLSRQHDFGRDVEL
jgi:hypothetical protein